MTNRLLTVNPAIFRSNMHKAVSGEYPQKYDGGVDIRSGNQNLKADEVEVTQSGEETNPVRYCDSDR